MDLPNRQKRTPRASRRSVTIDISTTLSALAHGVLSALAVRDDPAHGAANVVITRLLQNELDRVAPGAWDELLEVSRELVLEDGKLVPREPRAASFQVTERLLELLRPRRPEGSSR